VNAGSAATGTGAAFRYNAELAGRIEAKWQQIWSDQHTFETPNPSGSLSGGPATDPGRKLFVMDMFPYPSGAGLHVGHPLGYIASDVYARYMRMKGHLVLHPFGFDAFGLPAEQYAIETGQHPAVTTERNIATMRRQLRRLGLSHDPRREISTADPRYYRWTQWIFLQLFNSWRDPGTGRARPIGELIKEFQEGTRTVLSEANPDGRPWHELDAVTRRRVTDSYRLAFLAEAPVNWCPGLGTVLANEEVTADQRSLVGNYPVFRRRMRQWMLRITAFADRLLADLDGLDWSDSLKTMQRNWIGRSVGADIRFPVDGGGAIQVFTTRPETLFGATFLVLAPEHPLASELAARQGEAPKTAVFSGRYATNPASGARIPILIADYVLAGYGTGAIMGVPAHDERDGELAAAIGLPVVTVIADGQLVNSRGPGISLDGLAPHDARDRVVRWLEESGTGAGRVSYKLRDWLFSRQRYWGEPFPIVYDETGLPLALPEAMLPVELPPMTDFRPHAAGESEEPRAPLSRAPGFEMVELDLGGGPRRYRRETNTMPQWAGSCWYYLRYLDPDNDERFVDAGIEKFWMAGAGVAGGLQDCRSGGVDLYIGGVEHAVLHLLYARFWHKVLYDLGHVSTPEPFQRLYNNGYILAPAFSRRTGGYVPAAEVAETADGPFYRGEPVVRHNGKMGKSLKNSVAPDEIYQSYGADTLRMYEMAMGPVDADRPWQPDDIAGVHRFLQRLWRTVVDEETGELRPVAEELPEALDELTRRTVRHVRDSFDELRFNVAIARMTELNNALAQFAARDGAVPRPAAEALVLLAFPLAPHVAAELWEKLGHQGRIDDEPFPAADPATLSEESVTIPVTLDGKARGTITIDRSASEEEAVAAARPLAAVAALLADREVVRVVYVPGTILNLVTRAP